MSDSKVAMSSALSAKSTAILAMIAVGRTYEQIILHYPEFTLDDICDAADEALRLAEERPRSLTPEDRPPKAYSVERIRQGHPTAYAPWTSDQDERLRELVEQGLSTKDIAELMGRQPGGISSRIRKLHLDETQAEEDGHE